jgi:hypothetical protein
MAYDTAITDINGNERLGIDKLSSFPIQPVLEEADEAHAERDKTSDDLRRRTER